MSTKLPSCKDDQAWSYLWTLLPHTKRVWCGESLCRQNGRWAALHCYWALICLTMQSDWRTETCVLQKQAKNSRLKDAPPMPTRGFVETIVSTLSSWRLWVPRGWVTRWKLSDSANILYNYLPLGLRRQEFYRGFCWTLSSHCGG